MTIESVQSAQDIELYYDEKYGRGWPYLSGLQMFSEIFKIDIMSVFRHDKMREAMEKTCSRIATKVYTKKEAI